MGDFEDYIGKVYEGYTPKPTRPKKPKRGSVPNKADKAKRERKRRKANLKSSAWKDQDFLKKAIKDILGK